MGKEGRLIFSDGRLRRKAEFCAGDRIAFDIFVDFMRGQGNLSKKYQMSPYCVILNWLLSQSPWILPIPGARRIVSACDSPKAGQFEMEADDVATLDEIFKAH